MLYLIHFERPYKHARHYRGYCADGKLKARLARHRSGNGAKLLRIIMAAGIGWECVWQGKGRRGDERNLKKRPVSHICPICKRLAKGE